MTMARRPQVHSSPGSARRSLTPSSDTVVNRHSAPSGRKPGQVAVTGSTLKAGQASKVASSRTNPTSMGVSRPRGSASALASWVRASINSRMVLVAVLGSGVPTAVLLSGSGETAGEVAHGAAAVGAGGAAHVGDVGGGGRVGDRLAVVAGDRRNEAAGAGGAVGAELAGGGGDRVGRVVGVALSVPGPSRRGAIGQVELHRAGAAAGAVQPRAHAGEVGAAVVGFDLADAGQDRPRQPRAVLLHSRPIQLQVAAGDVQAGGGGRSRLVGCSPATVRLGGLLALPGKHAKPAQDDDGDDEPRRELDLPPDANLRVAAGDHRRFPGRAAAM